MQITMLAIGTRGDVQPYVALGAGLQRAGHRVRVASFENFEGLVTSHGLGFHPVPGDAEAILGSQGVLELVEPAGRTGIRNRLAMGRAWAEVVRSCGGACWEACRGADAIINQVPGGLYGFDAAEKLQVPYVSASVVPLTRTRAFPIPLLPPFSVGGWYNLLTYHFVEQAMWQTLRGAVNQWRKETLGLPKADAWGPFSRLYEERVPVLHGVSPRLVPRPPDWHEHVFVTGYWFLQERGWQPSAELLDFLDSGPAPVFVGFGSMPVRHPEVMTSLVVEALRRCGQRGVLGAGWAHLGGGGLPDDVFVSDYAPYTWLFPRMSALVHHGGSGSTAAGLRSGVPSVVVPFLLDQFYWGQRVAALGVGPEPIPRARLSANRLADAILRATSDPEMRRRAAKLGRQVVTEDGVARAVEVLDRHLGLCRAHA